MRAELKRILCLQGYDMDMAYEISQIKEETELYKGEELKFKLSQIAFKRSENKDAAEQKIFVDDFLFEKCLAETNPNHAETAKNRGFIRARYIPFFTDTGEGKIYRHGIVNIINIQAKVNKVEEVFVDRIHGLNNILRKISRDKMRLLSVCLRPHLGVNGRDGYLVKFTKQRYDFND